MQHHILTLDQAGQPSCWSTYEKAIEYSVKGLISWHLGDDFVFHGGISRATGERSIITVPSIIAVRGRAHASRIALTNQNLFSRDDQICCYCGRRFGRSALTREHIIPVSRGGANSWTNCATCCRGCNGAKGAKLPEEAGVKLLYVPYEPNVAEALILSGRNILADQKEFLLACLPKNSRVRAQLH